MLPDWPKLKTDLDLAFALFIRTRAYDNDLPVSQLKRVPVYEGDRNTTLGAEDFEDEWPISTILASAHHVS
ncbi:MAG: hypothetical protein MK052_06510 [Alphaproteobacteria bacterium]|nr:hypothetical protein [Alphaproteobacteria bacterium]